MNELYYLGPTASYSNQAALDYTRHQDGQILLKPRDTINQIFETVSNDTTKTAIVPIENTIAGDVTDTFNHLFTLRYKIIGEVVIPINHVLAAKKGVKIHDITKIYSHTQALLQCSHYLESLQQDLNQTGGNDEQNKRGYIEMVRTDSTSQAASLVSTGVVQCACICSPLAAKEYGLEILNNSISDLQTNYTRFVIIQSAEKRDSIDTAVSHDLTKHSAIFVVKNQVGSLVDVLGELKKQGANMTKLESKPIPDQPWHYKFFVEFVGKNIDIHDLTRATTMWTQIGSFEVSM